LAELPARLPIFPLTGALLLPGARLPFNIFEPRYLAMTEAALGDGRLIGMIQPLEGKGDGGDPPLYKTGCAGRIVEFRESGDGRYLIVLEGVSRFDVIAEPPRTELFRRVTPGWARYAIDRENAEVEGVDRQRLVAALGPFLQRRGVGGDVSAATSMPLLRLVNAVAMMASFAPAEKQALLEAGPAERAALLTQLVEMALLAGMPEDAPQRH